MAKRSSADFRAYSLLAAVCLAPIILRPAAAEDAQPVPAKVVCGAFSIRPDLNGPLSDTFTLNRSTQGTVLIGNWETATPHRRTTFVVLLGTSGNATAMAEGVTFANAATPLEYIGEFSGHADANSKVSLKGVFTITSVGPSKGGTRECTLEF